MTSISPLATHIIRRIIENGNPSDRSIDALRRDASKRASTALLTNTELMAAYRSLLKNGLIQKSVQLESLLTVKRMRSKSGVAIVTVLTKPYPCPGRCVYCPDEARMPKSYIATEPAAARALALEFDPYAQVRRRIEMLEGNGHPADKIELIIKGGTWSSYPFDYQQQFLLRCFDAMNHSNVSILLDAQTTNESAAHRCIGLTIETRPDFVSIKEIVRLRSLGVTRVELGVQTTDETVLSLIKRGHTTDHVIRATQLLKDAGFKVDYHLMPGLPGATPDGDAQCAGEIFSNPAYRPDMIKLYPTVVTPNTELEKWWKEGRYAPYTTEQLIPLLARIKSIVPVYCRISRVIRDIPSNETVAGNTKTNLRETVQKYMEENNMRCRCLRCREVGHKKLETYNLKLETLGLKIQEYGASGGTEYFLSFEDEQTDTVFAFLRMRLPSPENGVIIKHLPELNDAALIRELHTYGQLVKISESRTDASQHKGYGKKLLERAEQIVREKGFKKIAVISGIGVREYYRKRGYSLEGNYMVKCIEK